MLNILDQDNIQGAILTSIQEIIVTWGEDLLDPIESKTYLVQDLGFASIDFIQLIVLIEEHFEQKLGFHDLLMPNDKYIDDLSVEQLTSFVMHRLDTQSGNQDSLANSSTSSSTTTKILTNPDYSSQTTERLGIDALNAFLACLPDSKRIPDTSSPKNDQAIFLLSAPRSGSTVLRVILGGNPALFAPPELHLLDYNTLTDRQTALSNELNQHLLEGTIRAIMSLRDCSAEVAQTLMASYEQQALTTKVFYAQLQAWLGKRILVDKTPTYSFRPEYLQCAEAEFDCPIYIHLVRHPYGMIRSFCDAKLDKLVPFLRNSQFSRQAIAELLWIVSNQTISDFLQAIPTQRKIQVRFEDLVTNPTAEVNRICQILGINFDANMLDPYQDKNDKMTTGVYRKSQFSGDLKFHLHRDIDPKVADRWQQFHTDDFLGEVARNLAKVLGYEL